MTSYKTTVTLFPPLGGDSVLAALSMYESAASTLSPPTLKNNWCLLGILFTTQPAFFHPFIYLFILHPLTANE